MPVCDLCGSFALTGNVCAMCGLKASYERLEQAASVNLQTSTVQEMIDRFVIEEHQAKHYAGGDRKYAHFDQLAWKQVHQVIVCGLTALLTLQKTAGLIKPTDGYVQVDGMKAKDEWYAGKNRGTTNVVMIQLTMSIAHGFSGHGYPLDLTRFNQLAKDAYIARMENGAWDGIVLSSANNSIRIMHIGA